MVRALQGDSSIVNCIQWHPATAMMATSGIENVVRIWEPQSGELESNSSSKVVPDLIQACKENQHRMGVDPFEVMLMRMGFRLAMSEEGTVEQHVVGEEGMGEEPGVGDGGGAVDGDGGGGQDEAMEGEGEVRWIENPANCRQC